MSRAPRQPLVAIIGATGTGKSELAVEIARRFNGEVINGDAMQLYRGLPVITNKVTQEEMKGIPHHLLGRIGLEEETWTVGKFVKNALGVIDEIRSRGKLPILVGGTHYYTQSLLFQDALPDEPLFGEQNGERQNFPILNEPTDVVLEKLKEVDPVIAERWHPNERRKIQRSLELFLRTGKPASQIYEEQRMKRESSPTGSDAEGSDASLGRTGLRFPTLLLWVNASKDILYPRLDARIVKMIERGLLAEVESLSAFCASYEVQTGTSIDQTRGIWVSIGYKEFLEYQAALTQGSASDQDLEKLKAAAIEKTQAATRQYANRQIRWIRTKLINSVQDAAQKHNMFLFDGSDLSQWNEQVIEPSISIAGKFLAGEALPEPSQMSEAAGEMLAPKKNYDLARRPDLWQKKTCETCGTVAVTDNEWIQHIKSRAHRRAVGVKKKQLNAVQKPNKDLTEHQADMTDVFESYLGSMGDDETSK